MAVLSNEQVLIEAGVTPEGFLSQGQSSDQFVRNQYWNGIADGITSLTQADIDSRFGPGQTRKSVLDRVFEARREAETVTVEDSDNNKYVKRFKELRREHETDLGAQLVSGETIASIGFIDIGTDNDTSRLPGSIVPTSVVIEESFLNQKLDTVRTDTSPVIPSYNSSHRITFDIVFPDIPSINDSENGFRALYAQARSLPFITVESPLISAVYINKVVTPRILEAVGRRLLNEAKFDREVKDIATLSQSTLSEAIELLKSQDPFMSLVIDEVNQRLADERFSEDLSSTDLGGLDEALGSIADQVSFAIPVAMQGMTCQTMPGKPGALLTRWTFVRMNNGSFKNGEMLFRDKYGDPTFDIRDCIYARKFFTKLLDKNSTSSRYLSPIVVEDGTPVKPGVADYVWSDDFGQERRIDLPEFIDNQVTVRVKARSVELPISGSLFPMIQHMGTDNIQAHIVYSTKSLTDIQKFSQMKFELMAEGRKGVLRRGAVRVNHPLLAVFGARDFSLQALSIENATDYPDLYHVTVHLIENKVDLRNSERLYLSTNAVSGRVMRDFMDYMYNVYVIGFPHMSVGTVAEDFNADQARSITTVYKMIFGGNLDGSGGLFSPIARDMEVMNATLFKALHANKQDGYGWQSDASKDYPSLYEAHSNNKTSSRKRMINNLQEINTITGRNTPIRGVLRHRTGGDLFGSVKENQYPHSITELSMALVQMFNPIKHSASVMPRNMWDALTDILLKHRKTDSSTFELWTDAQIKTSYIIMMSVLVTDSTDVFVDVQSPINDPNFTFPKAVFPRKQLLQSAGLIPESRNTAKSARIDSTYPDLELPTYFELFSEPNAQGRPELIVDEEGKPVWTRFAPTYDDLGQPAPFDKENAFRTSTEGSSLIARNLGDEVEPSVFYFRRQVKRDVLRKEFDSHARSTAANSSDTIKRGDEVLALPFALQELQEVDADGKITYPDLGTLIQESIDTDRRSPDDRFNKTRERFKKLTKDKGRDTTIRLVTSEGVSYGVFNRQPGKPDVITRTIGARPEYLSSGNLQFDIQSKEHALQLEQAAIDHMEDHSKSMSRCYPAIKLYLIEEDREELIFSDDFYGFASIIDCNITIDKNDAAIATMKLSNYSGVLTEDEFIDQNLLGDELDLQDEEDEPFLKKFKIKAGTHIQIRMGYASGRQTLPIVFNGQVVESQPGEVVTIIAQGFKTELFNNVGLFNERYSATKDDTPNLRAVINKILGLLGDTPHLGRIHEFSGDELKNGGLTDTLKSIYGDQYSSGILGTGIGGQTGLVHEMFGGSYSDRARNIWYDAPGYFGGEWITTTKPGWDAIQEVVRFIPNYICQVVPYDADATVFVGNPAQVYRYSAMTEAERRTYLKVSPYLIAEKNLEINVRYHGFITQFLLGRHWSRGIQESLKKLDTRSFSPLNNSLFRTDHSAQWEYLGSVDPQLQRFLFARFYGFRFAGQPWPNRMEGSWLEFVNAAMKSLVKNGDEDSFEYTDAGRRVFEDFGNSISQNSSFSGPISSVVDTTILTSKDGTGFTPDIAQAAEYKRQRRELEKRLRNVGTSAAHEEDIIGPGQTARDITDRLENQIFELQSFEKEAKYGENPQIKVIPIPLSGSTYFNTGRREYDEDITQHVMNFLPVFRVFVSQFARWLQNDESKKFRRSIPKQLAGFRAAGLPPGYKVFRDYHFMNSDEDIIQNNIVASDSEMWNAVAIQTLASVNGMFSSYAAFKAGLRGLPDQSPGSIIQVENSDELILYPSNGKDKPPGINFIGQEPSSEDIMGIFMEPNASERTMAAWCIAAHMAEGLQKMYRGNLVVVGRNIKPWDVIILRDEESQMYGPIVVERATHHFSSTTGWVTTIVPAAYTTVNSLIATRQMTLFNHLASFLASDEFDNLMWFVTGVSIALAIANPVAGAIAAGARSVIMRRVAAIAAETAVETAVKKGVSKLAKNSVISMMGKAAMSVGSRATGIAARGTAGTSLAINGVTGLSGLAIGLFDQQAAMQLKDINAPVFVNTLQYRGRPFYAGLDLADEDFDSDFDETNTDRFMNMVQDARKAVRDMLRPNYDPGLRAKEAIKEMRKQ